VILVEKQPDGTYLGIDREDSIDWQKKFSNTKFAPLDSLGESDACTALRIVLECIKQLHTTDAHILFWICPFWNDRPDYRVITHDFDVAEFLAASALP
jgi:hypothetical protein